MEEILRLQQQLAAVQNTTVKTRLADRNVIEIINLLIQKYGLELHFSTDGNEFVTPPQLDQMIIDCVSEHSKISISDMPNYLLIGQKKIEDRIDHVLKKSDITLVDNFLISPEYLDRVFEEINEELQIKDEIFFSDIALKLSFSINFVKSEVSKRLGGVIDGVISDDKNGIMTRSYSKMFKSKVKGIALGQQGPCNIGKMAKLIGTEMEKFERCLLKLIEGNEIDGKIEGSLYIPRRFLQAKSDIVKGKFQKDGYVEYEWIQKKFNVKNVEKFLEEEIAEELIFLESCVYSKEATLDLKEEIQGNLETDGYLDVFTFFPEAFEEEDIKKILYEVLKMDDIIFEKDILLSKSKLQDCCKKIEPILLESLKVLYDPKSGKKAEEGKKKKNKKNKSAPKSVIPLNRDETIQHLSQENIIEYIVEDDVKDVFYDNLKPLLEARYSQLEEDLIKAMSSKSSNVINEVTLRIKHLYTSILLINQSIVKMIEAGFEFNENHLEELGISLAENFLDMSIFLVCKKFNIDVDKNYLREQDIAESTLPDFDKFSLGFFNKNVNLSVIIKKIEGDLKEYYFELLERVQAKNLVKLCEFLQENAVNMSLPLINLSKNTEKNYIHAQKYFLKDKARDLTKPTEILSFAVSSLLLENGICTWPVHPEKPVNAVLQWIFPLLDFVKEKLDKGVEESLREFWELSKDGNTDSKEAKLKMRDVKNLI